MLKKTALLLLVTLLSLSLVACGGSSAVPTLPDDKTPVSLPTQLVPESIIQMPDTKSTKETSSIYFESTASVEEIQDYYKTAFADIGIATESIKEIDEAGLVASEALPESTHGNSVVWGYFGQYTPTATPVAQDSEKQESATTESSTAVAPETPKKVSTFVSISVNGDKTAVMVAVGAQASRMAIAHKLATLEDFA